VVINKFVYYSVTDTSGTNLYYIVNSERFIDLTNLAYIKTIPHAHIIKQADNSWHILEDWICIIQHFDMSKHNELTSHITTPLPSSIPSISIPCPNDLHKWIDQWIMNNELNHDLKRIKDQVCSLEYEPPQTVKYYTDRSLSKHHFTNTMNNDLAKWTSVKMGAGFIIDHLDATSNSNLGTYTSITAWPLSIRAEITAISLHY